jgi:6-phosphofructokinase 1
MGHRAGHLALYVGLATSATAVLVPEKEFDFENDIVENIRKARLGGRTHFMIIMAEGVGKATKMGERIAEELALDTRVTILGHIQRGGSPSARDRVTAASMGYEAVKVLCEGKTNRVIRSNNGKFEDIDIVEALNMKKGLDEEQYEVLEAMTGIYH